jgi:hypothetical protein
VFRRLSIQLTAVAAVLILGVSAWGQAAPAAKNWKDRAEYDLYDSITKATDANKRLELLNTWKSKYPQTDFVAERNAFYVSTYQGLNQGQNLLNFCKETLAAAPKEMSCLYWATVLTISLANTAPDALDFGEKSAKSLLGNLDDALAPDKRPKGLTEEAAQKQRKALESQAHTTVGWVAMTRKSYEAAETAFVESLKAEPNNAQVSYWLGSCVLAQRKVEKQAAALYHFARAASLTGPGALPDAQRTQLDAYLTKVYSNFHGDSSGLPEIKAVAQKQPFPADDFTIKSSVQIATEKEEEFKKTNPMLALWMSIRKELAGPGGEAYFNEKLKDAQLPGGAHGVAKFKGKLISMKPAVNPKELVVGISDATTTEVTLRFDTPLKGKADVGTDLEFEGVAAAFAGDPFNLTLDLDKSKLDGWPVQAAAPVKKAAPAKKAAPKKK